MMFGRVLSMGKRGLISRLLINPKSRRFFCTNPSLDVQSLLTKLTQVPKPKIKVTLDSDWRKLLETSELSWEAIVVALRSSSPEKAQLVLEWRLEKMLEKNERDHGRFSDLISLCGKIRNVPLALQVFASMESQDVKPNSCVFNSLIHACLSSNNVLTALSLYDVMESSDSYKPTAETYDAFVLGLAELGNADAMKKWFLAKTDAGFSATLENFENLISGCVKARDFDGVDRFYEEMIQAGVMPSTKILESVLEGHCKQRDFIRIREFLKFLLDVGHRISANMAEKLVILFSDCRKVQEFEEILGILVESKQDPEILSSLHNGIIRMYAGLGCLDDVEYSVGRMLKEGLLFRCADDVEKVISAYFRQEAYDRLDVFLDHIKGRYQLTRSSYDLLVAGYRRAGLQEKLESVIEEMEMNWKSVVSDSKP